MLHQSCTKICVLGAKPASRCKMSSSKMSVKSHKARADGLVKPFDARCEMRQSRTAMVGCHQQVRSVNVNVK